MSTTLTLHNFGSGASAYTISSIMDGDTYSWRLDDSLDSGLIVYTSNSLTPVEPFTLATINFDDGSTEKMWVAEDSVVMLSKINNAKVYQHTLKLIELTKILEKIVVTGLCLTPVNKDSNTPMYSSLYEQFTKALLQISLQSSNITLNPSASMVSSRLTNAETETFVFSNSTAREILDEIFSSVDSRVVVDDVAFNTSTKMLTLSINYIEMVEGTSLVLSNNTHHKIISESAANSVESYAGEIYSSIEGAMCKNEISFQDTFKTNDALATSSNRVMSLPYAIQYPTKFRLKSTTATVTVKGTYHVAGDSSSHTITETYTTINGSSTRDFFDALDYFVDYEYWQVLGTVDQQKTFYYQRGATEVDVSRTYKSLIVTKSVFQTLFGELLNGWYTANYQALWNDMSARAVAAGGLLSSITKESAYTGDIDDIVFDISYIGEVDGLTTSSKTTDRRWFERDLQVVDNQRTSIVDLTRYGRNLEGKIARLGNDLFYIDCDVDSYSHILPLLTKLTDYTNGIIYQADISRHTDRDTWYEVRYYLSKNFNNINERIALKREKRIYAIPPKGYQVILPNRETIVIGDRDYIGDYDIVDSTNTFEYQMAKVVAGTSNQITNAFIEIQTDTDTYSPDPLLKKDFVLPVACYGSGNTINMVAKFYDNASAGLSIDTSSYGGINWLGGKKVSYNRYTNEYGFAADPKVKWGFFPNERLEAGVQAQPTRKKSGASFLESVSTIFECNYTYRKDPSEALCFQKIIKVEAGSSNVVIGCLADINSLFANIGNIYIYAHQGDSYNREYKPGDKRVKYDTTQGDYRMVLNPIITNNLETNTVDIKIADTLSARNYALGDANGNMFVAVNGLVNTKTLFRIARKEVRG